MSSVLPPPLLLLPPPPLLPESEPPQAVTPTANAATRQPEAAIQREFKEPLLVGISQRAAIVIAAPSRRQHCQNPRRIAQRAAPAGAEVSVARALVARQERRDDVRRGSDEHHDDGDHEGVEGLDAGRP